jgi:hypothetical protein
LGRELKEGLERELERKREMGLCTHVFADKQVSTVDQWEIGNRSF